MASIPISQSEHLPDNARAIADKWPAATLSFLDTAREDGALFVPTRLNGRGAPRHERSQEALTSYPERDRQGSHGAMMPPRSAASAAPIAPDAPTIWRVDDERWTELAPILTRSKPRQKPGCPRRDDRLIGNGRISLARTGAPWSQMPREFGPHSTLHERCTESTTSGARERAWAVLLHADDGESGVDWRGPAAAGCIVNAPCGTRGRGRGARHRAHPHRPRQTRHHAPRVDRGAGPAGQSHRCHPHHLSHGPPCAAPLRIACKSPQS